MGYIGMCGPKGYDFSAVLAINRVSILADFGHFGHTVKRFCFLHLSPDMGMFLKKPLFHLYQKKIYKSPSQILFTII